MSLFSLIKEKLGLGKKTETTSPQAAPGTPVTETGTTASDTAPAAQAISQVDVVAKLEGLAANNPEKLNWRTSIVDLLKLLGLDSSLSARKELATELHCPQDKLADSAQMNIWLHKTVMQKLAENGGNIPAELLS